jgi:tetratricopeptide (TPR) repeat protein
MYNFANQWMDWLLWWEQRLQWINRVRLTALVGLGFLGMSWRYNWYHLPVIGRQALVPEKLALPLGWIGSAALLVGISLALRYWGLKQTPRWMIWLSLLGVLLFPYGWMTWRPKLAFLAMAYWHQLSRVNLLVENSFADVQAQWKRTISLEHYQPLSSGFTFRIEDSRFFQLPSWDRVFLDGFGYNNSFFAFIGRGWCLSVMGLVVILLALYLAHPQGKLTILQRDLRCFGPIALGVISLLTLQMVSANLWQQQIEVSFAQGDYRQVLQQSERLARWYPPLRNDTTFLQHWGEATVYAQQPKAELVAFIQGLERFQSGDYERAETYFQQACQMDCQFLLFREYWAAALINQGVEYFNWPNLPFSPHGNNYPNFANSPLNPISPNSQRQLNNRKADGAARLFEQALDVFPAQIEALYDLLVVTAVDGQFEQSAAVADRIIAEQGYFQSPNIGLLGQAYLHKAWADYHRGDMSVAWESYRRSVDTKAWGGD